MLRSWSRESEWEIFERPESEILQSRSRVSESENLERSELESDILPPTPQPCFSVVIIIMLTMEDLIQRTESTTEKMVRVPRLVKMVTSFQVPVIQP